MLNDTKKDLIEQARKLTKPYEQYSIDELASTYRKVRHTDQQTLKDIYISALVLRFWYHIDKMIKSGIEEHGFDRVDCFHILYEGIEYSMEYGGWEDPTKKLNAQQCINKCINTILLQKLYDRRLDKHKAINYCVSMDAPICGDSDDNVKTLGDTLEDETQCFDSSTDDVIALVQSYINRNKVIEAILIDNIAFNDVQKHFKKTVKTTNASGETYRYTEHSSEFWPYKLIQIVSKLPASYKKAFKTRYTISDEKLNAVIDVIDRANNQKLYKYLREMLKELKASFAV